MKTLLILCFALLSALPARAAEPPPLQNADAKFLLELMEWKEVTIIAIRQGVDAKGTVAPIYATIVGLGKLRGEQRAISETVIYDKELDWYAIELGQKSARLWTKAGYREIRPWGTW
jgi:hypothetical protein